MFFRTANATKSLVLGRLFMFRIHKRTIDLLVIISSLAFYIPASATAQTLKTISDLEDSTQKHLDEGINMMGYTVALNRQMDSLLNVVYSKLRQKLPVKEKEALKQDQMAWLKKRDAAFQKLYRDEEKRSGPRDEWGEVEYLGVYSREVLFVENRVKLLMSKLNGGGKSH